MFGFGSNGKYRVVQRKLEDCPSFGPVQPRGFGQGFALWIVGTLLATIVCTGAALTVADGATARSLSGERLPPVMGTGCDGVWGDEPLDCLLQTA